MRFSRDLLRAYQAPNAVPCSAVLQGTSSHLLHTCVHVVQELFGRGSLFSVRELRTVRGERREITFYPAARLDGLLRRVEIFNCKLVEHFVGRDDHLVYRSATFDSEGAAAGAFGDASAAARPPGADSTAVGDVLGGQPLESAAGYGLPGSQQPQQQQQHARALPILKVTQKYERNVAKPADEDVSKQVFHLAMGKTIVEFHHADNRVTAGYLVFAKDGPAQAVQVSLRAVHMNNCESIAGIAGRCCKIQSGRFGISCHHAY